MVSHSADAQHSTHSRAMLHSREQSRAAGRASALRAPLTQIASVCVCALCRRADDALADGSMDGASGAFASQMTDGSAAGAVGLAGEDEVPLTKNDAWHVITAYFDEKGLVRQQLDRSAHKAHTQKRQSTGRSRHRSRSALPGLLCTPVLHVHRTTRSPTASIAASAWLFVAAAMAKRICPVETVAVAFDEPICDKVPTAAFDLTPHSLCRVCVCAV